MNKTILSLLVFLGSACINIPLDPEKEVEKEKWVKHAQLRFRQEGHVYFGEIFIDTTDITGKTTMLQEK